MGWGIGNLTKPFTDLANSASDFVTKGKVNRRISDAAKRPIRWGSDVLTHHSRNIGKKVTQVGSQGRNFIGTNLKNGVKGIAGSVGDILGELGFGKVLIIGAGSLLGISYLKDKSNIRQPVPPNDKES
jgi:hypothetical protein